MISYHVLLQNQFDAAQKLIEAQRTTISELKAQQEQLLNQQVELWTEVEAWRAHAKAYNDWFTTVPRVGVPALRIQYKEYRAAVEVREPYYQAAIQQSAQIKGDIDELKEDLS